MGTARNAIIVILAGFLSAYFYNNGQDMFKIIGEIPAGLPAFKIPPFGYTEIKNTTNGEITIEHSFTDLLSEMSSALIVIPLIALLENIAICKAFANGKAIDATQELIAIGTANIANSFVQGYPGGFNFQIKKIYLLIN